MKLVSRFNSTTKYSKFPEGELPDVTFIDFEPAVPSDAPLSTHARALLTGDLNTPSDEPLAERAKAVNLPKNINQESSATVVWLIAIGEEVNATVPTLFEVKSFFTPLYSVAQKS